MFRYSLQQLSCSLERLVESQLKVWEDTFIHLAHMTERQYGSTNLQAKIKLLTLKGVFHYDYFENLEVLNETTLLSLEAFFNRLS